MWGENTELGYKRWWRKSENRLKTWVSKIFQLSLTTSRKHWLGRWKRLVVRDFHRSVFSPFGYFAQNLQRSDAVTATAYPQCRASGVVGPGICVGFEQCSCSAVVLVGQTGDRMNDQKDQCWDCALRTWLLLRQRAVCIRALVWSQRNPRVWSLFLFL